MSAHGATLCFSAVSWGLLLLFIGVCHVADAQSGPTTPTTPPTTPPPTAFDNTVINTTYIDLVTTYVVQDLFDAPDQLYWPFLIKAAAALTDAGVPAVPASSLKANSPAATVATATIGLRRFTTSNQLAVPYREFSRYLLTLVHKGTAQHAATTIDAINNGALEQALGVEQAHFIPDITSIYADGGIAVGSGDSGQLGIGWHILLVVGVTLVYGLIITARYRQQTLQDSRSKGSALDGHDPTGVHAYRWEEADLEKEQDDLLERTAVNENARAARGRGGFDEGDAFAEDRALAAAAGDSSHPLNASVRQLAACKRAMADVEENDIMAQQAGTLTVGEASVRVANRTGAGGSASPDRKAAVDPNAAAAAGANDDPAAEWSLSRVQDILALEPAYNLPPASGLAAHSPSIPGLSKSSASGGGYGARGRRGARVAALEAELEAKRRAEEEARQRADDDGRSAGGSADADVLDLDLPPDASEAEIRERQEELARKEARTQVPLGLQARRIARMMTTLGEDPSLLNPTFHAHTVHRSYQLTFSPDVQSPLRQRRGLRAAQFVVKEEIVPADPGEGSPGASPSPDRDGTIEVVEPPAALASSTEPPPPLLVPPTRQSTPAKLPLSQPPSNAASRRPSMRGQGPPSKLTTPTAAKAPAGLPLPPVNSPARPQPLTAADMDDL